MGAAGASTDPWVVLGIPSSATAEEVRAAWKSAALRTHPDKVLDDGAQFRIVQAAYETLRDASTWRASAGEVVRGATNGSRAEQAAAEQKAALRRHFEEKFRRFLAEEEAKKRAYELKARQFHRFSPAEAFRARQKEQLAERHQRKLQESREQAEVEERRGSGTGVAAGSRQQKASQQQPLEAGTGTSDGKAVHRQAADGGAAESATDTNAHTPAGLAACAAHPDRRVDEPDACTVS